MPSSNQRSWRSISIGIGVGFGMLIMSGQAFAQGSVWEAVPIPDQVPVTEEVVSLPGGANLWYWDTGGTGEAIILLHAGTQSGASWAYQQPVFAQSGYRVIGYSRRGYYMSGPGSQDDPGFASEDLHELMDHLAIDRAHIIAAAHGGYFAIDFALSYPERTSSLILISSLMGISEDDFTAARSRINTDSFRGLPADEKELSPGYRFGNAEGHEEWLKLEHAAIPGERITPNRVNELTWEALRSITAPALVITGDADLYTPPAMLRMQVSHMAPQTEMAIISEASHSANWEQPEAFNELVLRFLAQ